MAEATAVEQRNKEMAQNAHTLLEKLKPSIAAVLPRHLTPERMAMIAFTAMRRNPELMKCSAQSIIGSIMTASMLGLEPSGPLGHGALVPYKGECQFQPMYQGLLELSRRSGLIKDVQLRAVYRGDTYKFSFGLDPTIEHIPLEGDGADNPDRQCTHVYCIIRFTNGGVQWDQMSYAQAMAHGKRFSKTFYQNKFTPGTPWAEHPVAMCLKTILKQTLKLCPKSPELAIAMSIDDMGEVGRTAQAKKLTDGSIDVDFGEDPGDDRDKGTVDLNDLRAGSEENRGHGNENLANTVRPETPAVETAAAEQKPKAAEPPQQMPLGDIQPEEVCTDAQFDILEKARNHHKVEPKVFIEYVKKALGYPMVSKLRQKDYERSLKWLQAAARRNPNEHTGTTIPI